MRATSIGKGFDFERSPIPGVAIEAIEFVMSLPEEVRVALGNFLLDSAVDGFEAIAETPAQLWKNEIQRRVEDAIAHPEKLIPANQVFERLRKHLEQLRRTPKPNHLHGYHCTEYFRDGWAENGLYDQRSHYWLINPVRDLDDNMRSGFFAIGGPGVDGVLFCYRYGHKGLWAYYPIEQRFAFLAPSLVELVEGWNSGKITV
jgi:Putative addiction module component